MEAQTTTGQSLSELGEWAIQFYAERLRPVLEPEHNGDAVAIHRETGDYALGESHTLARRRLKERHGDGLIATLTVGPPTFADIGLAYRALAGGKS